MDKKIYTTYEVAKFCQVTMLAVVKWINQGKLPAYRTPGGHRRVKAGDILAFLRHYHMPIPAALQFLENKRVLVVDDDPQVVSVIERALEKLGLKMEIASASDGFEAGQKVADFSPDLVLLDLKLPGIDGFRVCKNIKKRMTTKIKVLAMTGYDTTEFRKMAARSGADGYIAKPFKIRRLIEIAGKLLGIETDSIIGSCKPGEYPSQGSV